MNKRNYAIDFFRMIFMIIICIHHFQGTMGIKYIQSGYLCVEFFFILSGFYLYNSFNKYKEDDGIKYTIKKIKKIYPHYILAFLFYIFFYIIRKIINHNLDIVEIIYKSFSETLLLQNIGIFNGGFNYPLWYLSVLLLGGYLIYELLRKNKETFLKIIGPIIILFTFTLIKSKNGSIENWGIIYGLYMPLLREIADLTTGCILAWIYQEYNEKLEIIIKNNKKISNIIECYVYFLLFYIIINKTEYEFYSLILFTILILYANLKISISSKFLNNKIFKNNGDLTYAMYLNHAFIIMILSFIYEHFLFKYINIEIISVIYIFSVIVYSYFTDKFVKYLINKNERQN